MKTLIIYCHPDIEGHNSHILSEVKERLDKNKLEYEVLDLYKLKYDPVLSETEMKDRKVDAQTKEFQDKISATEKIIFIYPVWWGSMPAMIKGFFDRTFTSGYAFKYSEKGIPHGLLKGKKAAVFITSGSPTIISRIWLQNRYQKTVKDDILDFCGINTKVYQFGKSIAWNDEKKKEIHSVVKQGIRWLY